MQHSTTTRARVMCGVTHSQCHVSQEVAEGLLKAAKRGRSKHVSEMWACMFGAGLCTYTPFNRSIVISQGLSSLLFLPSVCLFSPPPPPPPRPGRRRQRWWRHGTTKAET